MSFQEQIHDVAQLAMVELFTPKFEESLWFFHDVLGMTPTEDDGTSCYLRAYEDRYHHSLKLTRADHAGVGVVAWRASSPQALDRRVAEIEASGKPGQWVEGHKGYGRAYEFATPDGHKQHLFWDVEYFQPSADQKSKLLSRPQKRPLRGVPVRRIDHINLLTSDVTENAKFMQDTLGFLKRKTLFLAVRKSWPAGCRLARWCMRSRSPKIRPVRATVCTIWRSGMAIRARCWTLPIS
jgi:catechol 2,3-dioxygenase